MYRLFINKALEPFFLFFKSAVYCRTKGLSELTCGRQSEESMTVSNTVLNGGLWRLQMQSYNGEVVTPTKICTSVFVHEVKHLVIDE